MLLDDSLSCYMILLVDLDLAGSGIGLLIRPHLVERSAGDRIGRQFKLAAKIAGAPDIPKGGNILPGGKPPGRFPPSDAPMPKGKQIGTGIHQNRGADLIIPIVIVGKPAQRRLSSPPRMTGTSDRPL